MGRNHDQTDYVRWVRGKGSYYIGCGMVYSAGMRRRLFWWAFNGTAAVSALLLLATCALWVRSYMVTDGIQTPLSSPILAIWSQCGRVELYESYAWPSHGWQYDKLPASAPIGLDSYRQFAGFSHWSSIETHGDYSDTSDTVLPYWFLVSVMAITPVGAAIHRMRYGRRHRFGLCQVCGYDLRATPERCPECGAIPKKVEPQTQAAGLA